MNLVLKLAQYFGFAVAAILVMLVTLSVVVNQLPVETTAKYTVTEITHNK